MTFNIKTVVKFISLSILPITVFAVDYSNGIVYFSKSNAQGSVSNLSPDCQNMFNNSNPGGYTYILNNLAGTGTFALADDGRTQACGFDASTNIMAGLSFGRGSEARAIANCENTRPNTVLANCRTFAINKWIVWGMPRFAPDNSMKMLWRKIEAPLPSPPPSPQPPRQAEATPTPAPSIEDAKLKCSELGFTPATPKFGDCVLKLSR